MAKRVTDFDYKPVRFDPKTMMLRVVFDGGPEWADIPLTFRGSPPPTTREELDALVQQHTATREDLEAAELAPDLSFITEAIEVEETRNVPRFSIKEKIRKDQEEAAERQRREIERAMAEEREPVSAPEQLQIAEEEWIGGIVAKEIEKLVANGTLVRGPKK